MDRTLRMAVSAARCRVDLRYFSYPILDAVVSSNRIGCVAAEYLAQLAIAGDGAHGAQELLRLRGTHEYSVLAACDERGQSADRGGDHGDPVRHCLEDDHGR